MPIWNCFDSLPRKHRPQTPEFHSCGVGSGSNTLVYFRRARLFGISEILSIPRFPNSEEKREKDRVQSAERPKSTVISVISKQREGILGVWIAC
ncbi:Hypothetical predicted protein [Cloeon dipterum]|uniref:Uncharacterized protein n=1 Tax=Cloeon dipterum TaxID=197152 RepID=A0A8S1E3Q1_9INSE|nr:Hypothetical predicted protein [Cloeon dipterum]